MVLVRGFPPEHPARREQGRRAANPDRDLTRRQKDTRNGVRVGRWESGLGMEDWGTTREGAALNHAALRGNATP